MATVRIIGIVIMLLGIALKIAGLPGYTPAFVAGAVLIVFARIARRPGKPSGNA